MRFLPALEDFFTSNEFTTVKHQTSKNKTSKEMEKLVFLKITSQIEILVDFQIPEVLIFGAVKCLKEVTFEGGHVFDLC